MGRSSGEFLVPAAPAHAVLGRTAQWGAFEQMLPSPTQPGQVALSRGDPLTGGRRWLVVSAADTPQGAHVRVEVWTQIAEKELNADSRGFRAAFNQKDAWNQVVRLLVHLGAGNATGALRHG